MNKLTALARWVQTKTVTLTAIAALVFNGGEVWGWWHWDADQLAWANGAVALFLALVVSGTVTANARLGAGKVWGGYGGKR